MLLPGMVWVLMRPSLIPCTQQWLLLVLVFPLTVLWLLVSTVNTAQLSMVRVFLSVARRMLDVHIFYHTDFDLTAAALLDLRLL